MRLNRLMALSVLAGSLAFGSANSYSLEEKVQQVEENRFERAAEDLRKLAYGHYEKRRQGHGYSDFDERVAKIFAENSIEYSSQEQVNKDFFESQGYVFNFMKLDFDKTAEITLAKIDKKETVHMKQDFIDEVLTVYYLSNYLIEDYRKHTTGKPISNVSVDYSRKVVYIDQDYSRKIPGYMWNMFNKNEDFKPKTKEEELMKELNDKAIIGSFREHYDGVNTFTQFFNLLYPMMVKDSLNHEVFHIYAKKHFKMNPYQEENAAEYYRLSKCELGSFCTTKNLYNLTSKSTKNSKRAGQLYSNILNYIKDQKLKGSHRIRGFRDSQKTEFSARFGNININGDTLIGQMQDLWKLRTKDVNEIGRKLLKKHTGLEVN